MAPCLEPPSQISGRECDVLFVLGWHSEAGHLKSIRLDQVGSEALGLFCPEGRMLVHQAFMGEGTNHSLNVFRPSTLSDRKTDFQATELSQVHRQVECPESDQSSRLDASTFRSQTFRHSPRAVFLLLLRRLAAQSQPCESQSDRVHTRYRLCDVCGNNVHRRAANANSKDNRQWPLLTASDSWLGSRGWSIRPWWNARLEALEKQLRHFRVCISRLPGIVICEPASTDTELRAPRCGRYYQEDCKGTIVRDLGLRLMERSRPWTVLS